MSDIGIDRKHDGWVSSDTIINDAETPNHQPLRAGKGDTHTAHIAGDVLLDTVAFLNSTWYLDYEYATVSAFVEVLYDQEPAVVRKIMSLLRDYQNSKTTYSDTRTSIAQTLSPPLADAFLSLVDPSMRLSRLSSPPPPQFPFLLSCGRIASGSTQKPTANTSKEMVSTSPLDTSNPIAELRSLLSVDDRNEKSLNLSPGEIEEAVTLFDRIFLEMQSDKELFSQFVKCLSLYMMGCFSLSEVLMVLERIFPMSAKKLPYQLKEFLATREAPRRHGSLYMCPLSHLNPAMCRHEGQSYLELPVNFHRPWCSGRELEPPEIRDQLNNDFISIPRGSEDDGFTHPKHNAFEDAMFRLEDEMFEFDVIIGGAQSLIAALHPLEIQLAELGDQYQELVIREPLLKVVHLKVLTRVYGLHAEDVLELFHRCPGYVLPLLLERLREKVAQWEGVRTHLASTLWIEIAEKNYYKQFEHRLYYLKVLDRNVLSAASVMEAQALALYYIHRNLYVPEELSRKLRHLHKKVVHQTAGFPGCPPTPKSPREMATPRPEQDGRHDVDAVLANHPGATLHLDYESRSALDIDAPHSPDIRFYRRVDETFDAEVRQDVITILLHAAQGVAKKSGNFLRLKRLLSEFVAAPPTTRDHDNSCLSQLLDFSLNRQDDSLGENVSQWKGQTTSREDFSINTSDKRIVGKASEETFIEPHTGTGIDQSIGLSRLARHVKDATLDDDDGRRQDVDDEDSLPSASEKQQDTTDSDGNPNSTTTQSCINAVFNRLPSLADERHIPIRVANGLLYSLVRLYWVLYLRLVELKHLIKKRKDPTDPTAQVMWSNTDDDAAKRLSYREFVKACILPRVEASEALGHDVFLDELRVAAGNQGVLISTLPLVVSSAVKLALTAVNDVESIQLVALYAAYQAAAFPDPPCFHFTREYLLFVTTLLGPQAPRYCITSSPTSYCDILVWTSRDYTPLLRQTLPVTRMNGFCSLCGASPTCWYMNKEAGLLAAQPVYYPLENVPGNELIQMIMGSHCTSVTDCSSAPKSHGFSEDTAVPLG